MTVKHLIIHRKVQLCLRVYNAWLACDPEWLQRGPQAGAEDPRTPKGPPWVPKEVLWGEGARRAPSPHSWFVNHAGQLVTFIFQPYTIMLCQKVTSGRRISPRWGNFASIVLRRGRLFCTHAFRARKVSSMISVTSKAVRFSCFSLFTSWDVSSSRSSVHKK